MQFILYGFVFVLCAINIYTDVTRRIIPNYVCILLALAFIPHALHDLPLAETLTRIASAGAIFGIAFLAWLAGWFGAGDVKFLGAGSLWVAPANLPLFLLLLAASSLVIAVAMLIGRRFSASKQFKSCPYGVPIAISILGCILEQFAL